jgi:hypothetical protein
MSVVWTILLGLGEALASTVIVDEIRGHLARIPFGLLRLAARRLPGEVREDVINEWTAELEAILQGSEELLLTRLCRGFRFALGLWRTAPRIGADLGASSNRPAITVFVPSIDRMHAGGPAVSGSSGPDLVITGNDPCGTVVHVEFKTRPGRGPGVPPSP